MTRHKGVFLYRDYVTLLQGDILTALILSQIVFWYLPSKKTGKRKLQVFKNSKFWLAKSHRDWETECGLSRMQSRRCIEILKAAYLIETEIHKFAGTPTLHLRLLPLNGKPMVTKAPSLEFLREYMVSNGSPEMVYYPPEDSKLDSTNQSCTDTIIQETTTGSLALTVQQGEDDQDNRGSEDSRGSETQDQRIAAELGSQSEKIASFSPANQEPSGSPTMTAEEMLRYLKEKNAGVVKSSLGAYWLKLNATVFGTFQPPLTMKELGQLKHLKQKLGEVTPTVLDYVVNHWWIFASRAGSESGTPFPTSPHLGFLLQHYGVAVNLLQSSASSSSGGTPAIPMVAAPSPAPCHNEEQETPHLLTAEELAEMLNGLKE